MSRPGARVFSRELKEAAVGRILAGEKVKVLAVELGVWPKLLYDWWARYEQGGAEALVPPGRPLAGPGPARGPRRGRARRAARAGAPRPDAPEGARIAELERKVGQQALELDFFVRALRHIEGSRPPKAGHGVTASSRSSTR
jgi:transposase